MNNIYKTIGIALILLGIGATIGLLYEHQKMNEQIIILNNQVDYLSTSNKISEWIVNSCFQNESQLINNDVYYWNVTTEV